MAFSIEDVNSRTILQQFHSLYKKQEEDVENLDTKIDQEKSERQTADAGLQASINANATSIKNLQNGKQDKLTAGTNITIDENNVISATGGISSVKAENVDSESATNGQVLTANGSGGASWQNASGGTPSNMVTTDTAQTITGTKKFINHLNVLRQNDDNKGLSINVESGILLSFGSLNNFSSQIRLGLIDGAFSIAVGGKRKVIESLVENSDVPYYLHIIKIEENGNICIFEIYSNKTSPISTYQSVLNYFSSKFGQGLIKTCTGVETGRTNVRPYICGTTDGTDFAMQSDVLTQFTNNATITDNVAYIKQ